MDKAKRTSKEIEEQMDAERQTVKRLQAKLEAAKAEVGKAEQEQDRAAYQALAHEDKAAQKRLDDAEERLAKAERHVKSYEKAISQARQKFNELEAQWKLALWREDLERLKALAQKRIGLAPRLDAALKDLLAVHGEFNQLTREMLELKQGLGLNRVKLYEDNLREWLRVTLYPAFGEFKVDKTFGVFRERASMAELETLCFEKLLEMEDAPEGGGEPQPNGHDPEIQAVEPEPETEAGAGA